MTIHSPLGASSAERWMNCPGSVALIQALKLEGTDDPEYRKMGTAAHAAAAHITLNDMDAWEVVGQKFEDADTKGKQFTQTMSTLGGATLLGVGAAMAGVTVVVAAPPPAPPPQ